MGGDHQLQCDTRRWGLGEEIRSQGSSPQGWDQCSDKKDPRDLSHPLHPVRTSELESRPSTNADSAAALILDSQPPEL